MQSSRFARARAAKTTPASVVNFRVAVSCWLRACVRACMPQASSYETIRVRPSPMKLFSNEMEYDRWCARACGSFALARPSARTGICASRWQKNGNLIDPSRCLSTARA